MSENPEVARARLRARVLAPGQASEVLERLVGHLDSSQLGMLDQLLGQSQAMGAGVQVPQTMPGLMQTEAPRSGVRVVVRDIGEMINVDGLLYEETIEAISEYMPPMTTVTMVRLDDGNLTDINKIRSGDVASCPTCHRYVMRENLKTTWDTNRVVCRQCGNSNVGSELWQEPEPESFVHAVFREWLAIKLHGHDDSR